MNDMPVISDMTSWIDASDVTTLFQDEAGTIPVEKDGDPVRLILDKSGNGNHMRPVGAVVYHQSTGTLGTPKDAL
jgi:hypothetical protein